MWIATVPAGWEFAEPMLFAVVVPHAFPSEFLGESRRAVGRLFTETLADLTGQGLPPANWANSPPRVLCASWAPAGIRTLVRHAIVSHGWEPAPRTGSPSCRFGRFWTSEGMAFQSHSM